MWRVTLPGPDPSPPDGPHPTPHIHGTKPDGQGPAWTPGARCQVAEERSKRAVPAMSPHPHQQCSRGHDQHPPALFLLCGWSGQDMTPCHLVWFTGGTLKPQGRPEAFPNPCPDPGPHLSTLQLQNWGFPGSGLLPAIGQSSCSWTDLGLRKAADSNMWGVSLILEKLSRTIPHIPQSRRRSRKSSSGTSV